jgi:curved DNA-binding protein CbpA
MSKRDYYETLGISKGATAEEIKKAYRRKAKELHPDRNADNPASEGLFKEANEAYEVLKDSNKKAAYDRYGHAAFEGGMGGGGGGRPAGKGISPVPFPMSSTTFLATSWADAAAVAGNVPRAARTCAIICASPSKRRFAGCKKPSMCQRLCPAQIVLEQAQLRAAHLRPVAPAPAWARCARSKDFSQLSAPAPVVLAQGR